MGFKPYFLIRIIILALPFLTLDWQAQVVYAKTKVELLGTGNHNPDPAHSGYSVARSKHSSPRI